MNLGAETVFSRASKFENLIYFLQLIFELGQFKPPIDHIVFSLETRITRSIACKINTNIYCMYLSCKFQVFTYNRYEIMAISRSGSGLCKFPRKKQKSLRRKASRRCRNGHNLNLEAEIAFSGVSNFENFIFLLQLDFELQ